MSSIANAQRAEPSSIEGNDILRGVESIGRVLGLSERSAYHLVASGALRSVKKVGGRYFANRSRLLNEVIGSSD
jgi:hypothetical protein